MARLFKFYYLKMLRQSGTPEYVARGVALGLAVGFAIPFGLQLLVVIPLAFLLKAAKVMACAFTFVTNHFTIIVIYPIQTLFGAWILGAGDSCSGIEEKLESFAAQPSWDALWALGPDIALAFFVGGAIFAVAAAVPGYFVSLYAVRHYRALRERRRERKNLAA